MDVVLLRLSPSRRGSTAAPWHTHTHTHTHTHIIKASCFLAFIAMILTDVAPVCGTSWHTPLGSPPPLFSPAYGTEHPGSLAWCLPWGCVWKNTQIHSQMCLFSFPTHLIFRLGLHFPKKIAALAKKLLFHIFKHTFLSESKIIVINFPSHFITSLIIFHHYFQ